MSHLRITRLLIDPRFIVAVKPEEKESKEAKDKGEVKEKAPAPMAIAPGGPAPFARTFVRLSFARGVVLMCSP